LLCINFCFSNLCCESRLSRPQSRCGAVFLSLSRQHTAVRRGWVSRSIFGFRGRDAGAGCGFGAVRIGAFSLKGKRRFCHYFFNRLEGNFGILLNPKILFSKTNKPFLLSSIVRSNAASIIISNLHLFSSSSSQDTSLHLFSSSSSQAFYFLYVSILILTICSVSTFYFFYSIMCSVYYFLHFIYSVFIFYMIFVFFFESVFYFFYSLFCFCSVSVLICC
jgi:hypothetical protein